MMSAQDQYVVYPVTPERWQDLETLFGPRGAMGGCWCMWWRVKRKDWEASRGNENRTALKALVDAGRVPGLLMYDEGQPVGWVSVGPREDFGVLQRSPVLKPVDDKPVWSIVCFYIHRDYRGRGLTSRLIDAAIKYAHAQGATIVEGYPIEPRTEDVPDPYAYTGFVSTFQKAGFMEVARRSEHKPIMRFDVDDGAGESGF